jgi:anti-sigma factor RsiW
MNTLPCEQIRIAAMALADGELSELTYEEIEAHTATCAACAVEIAAMASVNDLFAPRVRRTSTIDVWPHVAERITPFVLQPRMSFAEWRILVAGGAILAIVKILELVPDDAPTLLLRCAPALVAIALLYLLKDNLFIINTQLTLKGE